MREGQATIAAATAATARRAGEPARAQAMLWVESACVFGLAALVYIITQGDNHNEGGDGIGYMTQVRSGDAARIFNPYHAAFNWLAWSAWRVARLAGYGGGPIAPVQVMNSLLGAATLAALWWLARRTGASLLSAATACGLVGVSFGFWIYATDVELYTLLVFFLVLTMAAAWRAAMQPSSPAFALAGVANGFAVLGHNTSVLFLFVALAAVWLAREGRPPRALASWLAAYLAGGVAVILPVYALAVPVVGLDSRREYYDWLTAYAQSGEYGRWSAGTAPKVAIGASRAVVGGHFMLAVPRVREFLEQHFPEKSIRKEAFIVRDVAPAYALALAGVAAVAVAGLAALAAGWLRRPALTREQRALAVLAVAWLVPSAVFFAWWQPENSKFWIAPWVPLALLLALPLAGAASSRWRTLIVATTLGALLVANLGGAIWLQRPQSSDYWRVRSAWYAENARTDDLIFTNDYVYAEYLRYFGRGTVVDLGTDVLGNVGPPDVGPYVQRIIDAHPEGRVLFSAEFFYPGDDEFSTCAPRVCEGGAAARAAFLPRSQQIADVRLERVWELRQR